MSKSQFASNDLLRGSNAIFSGSMTHGMETAYGIWDRHHRAEGYHSFAQCGSAACPVSCRNGRAFGNGKFSTAADGSSIMR